MTTGHRSNTPLDAGLRPGVRDLCTIDQHLLAFIAEGVNPPKTVFATFPQTGLWEPLPAGRTVFDLRNMRAHAPHQDFDLQAIINYDEIRSFVIAVDGLCAVEAQPTGQKFVVPPGVIEIASRDVERVIFEADAGFLMQLAWGTAINGVDIWVPSVNMLRYSATVLTKSNGAGIIDDFETLLFVPRAFTLYAGLKTLDQATFGNLAFGTLGYSSRSFLVRNTGSVDLDVVVRGFMYTDVFAVEGAVNDPDTGVGGGAPVSVPAGVDVLLRSSTPFLSTQVAARVSANEAAGTSSTVIVEVYAILPSGGGR